MSRRYYKLPPLTSLATFETSARHRSFKGAAEELGVTPGAVSHQIKFLETELGLSLFDRKHHGNNLTDHGESLFAVLQSSFTAVSSTLANLRRSASDKEAAEQRLADATLGLDAAKQELFDAESRLSELAA